MKGPAMPPLAQTLVPDLEQPAAVVRYALESPAPAAVLAVLAALIAGYVLLRLGRARAGLIVVLVLLALAGGVVALASFVETSRETVMEQSRAFVDAAATGRRRDVADLLSADAGLGVAERPGELGRDAVLGLVDRVGAQDLLVSHSINEVRAGRVIRGELATQVQVTASARGGGAWPTWWQLDWTRTDAGDWRLSRITWLTLGPTRPSLGALTR